MVFARISPTRAHERPSWFREALVSPAMVVSPHETSAVSGRPAFQCALGARDSLGRLRAVVFTSIDLERFAMPASRAHLPTNASLVIVDRRGLVLSHQGAWVGRRLVPPGSGALALTPTESTHRLRGPDGVERVFGFTALADADESTMYAGVGLPVDEIVATASRSLLMSLLVLAAIAALIITLAFHLLHGAVLAPLAQLAQAARRVREGDLATRPAPVQGAGEIATLARAFDDMTTALATQRQAEATARDALRVSEARKAAVLAVTVDGIVTFDRNGRVLEFNPAAERLFGYSARAVLGHSLADLVLPPDAWDAFVHADSTAATIVAPLETMALRADLTEFPAEVAVIAASTATGERLFTATIRDITERKRHEEALRSLLLSDELTSLHNRRGFQTFARQALRSARRRNAKATVMYFDLDGFKSLNDSLGHDEGDRALAAFARALRATFRDSDVLGRLGGDEFAALAVDAGDTDRLVERLREATARETAAVGAVQLAFSVGVAHTRATETATLDELLTAADGRMYVEKRRRKADRASGRVQAA